LHRSAFPLAEQESDIPQRQGSESTDNFSHHNNSIGRLNMLRARILIPMLTCLLGGLTFTLAQEPETKPQVTQESVTEPESTEKPAEARTPFKLVIHTDLAESSPLKRLEKLALRLEIAQALEPVANRNPRDDENLLHVNLQLPASRSVESHIEILKKIAIANSLNLLIEIGLFPDDQNAQFGRFTSPNATITAGRDVSHASVLNLLKTLAEAGIEQSFFESNSATLPRDSAVPFNTTLLLVESTWSKSPSAKEIESDLQTALKDVAMPDEFRSELLLAGPNILFAEENVTIYQPKDLAALVGWLEKHKLIRNRFPGSIATISAIATPDPNRKSPEVWFSFESNFSDTTGILSPSTTEPQAEHPFVKSWLGWQWKVKTNSQSNSVSLEYELHRFQQALGQTGHDSTSRQRTFRTSFELPADRLAIVHGFAGAKTPPTGLGETLIRVPESGLIPLLLIGRSELPSTETVALKLPELVIPVRDQGFFTNPPPTTSSGRNSSRRPVSALNQRAPIRSATTSGSPASSSQNVLQVFALKYSEADSVAQLLGQLWESDLRITVDSRTNSLICHASQARIDEIETLIQSLDVPATKANVKVIPLNKSPGGESQKNSGVQDSGRNPGTLGAPSPSLAPTTSSAGLTRGRDQDSQPAQLKKQYAASNQLTKELARELREAARNRSNDQSHVDQLKSKLRQAVAEAFSLRQASQQAELAELERRVQALRQTIIVRERILEAIVDRRVEDLLNLESQWEPDSEPETSATSSAADAEFYEDFGITNVNRNARPTGARPTVRHPNTMADPLTSHAGDNGNVIIHTPQEFQRLLDDSVSLQVRLETQLENMKQEEAQTKPGVTERELRRLNQNDWIGIQRARQGAKLIREELTTQLKLLELQVSVAEAKVAESQRKVERMQQLFQKQVATRTELDQEMSNLRVAEAGLNEATLLLELYHKIDAPDVDLKPTAPEPVQTKESF